MEEPETTTLKHVMTRNHVRSKWISGSNKEDDSKLLTAAKNTFELRFESVNFLIR